MLKKNKGFTLIELIAGLVLFGILTSFVGIGLVDIVKSYTFSQENNELAQKAQLALTRIKLELVSLSDIYLANPNGNQIKYSTSKNATKYELRSPPGESRIYIGYDGGKYTLIDNVGSYSGKKFLTFKKDDDTTWTPSGLKPFDLSELTYIEVLIILKKSDASEVEYRSVLNIRNNGCPNFITPDLES